MVLTQFVLTRSYLSFHLLNKLAPFYANLFMRHLEQQHLNSSSLKHLIWIWFTDDIFIQWTHKPDALSNFLLNLNTKFPNKFTWNYSPTNIIYLDVDKHLNSGLITSVHVYTHIHKQSKDDVTLTK